MTALLHNITNFTVCVFCQIDYVTIVGEPCHLVCAGGRVAGAKLVGVIFQVEEIRLSERRTGQDSGFLGFD